MFLTDWMYVNMNNECQQFRKNQLCQVVQSEYAFVSEWGNKVTSFGFHFNVMLMNRETENVVELMV